MFLRRTVLILPANTAQDRSGYARHATLAAYVTAVREFLSVAAEICAGDNNNPSAT